MSVYPDKVWKLFREPPRAGCFDDMDGICEGQATTPASHARLVVQLRKGGDSRIADARFQALGCPYLIATGAWLCAHAIGRRAESLAGLDSGLIVEQLELPAVKRYCAVMALEALKQALDPAPQHASAVKAATGSQEDE